MAAIRNSPDEVGATYGRVAARYADAFGGELAAKPLDRALLDWFTDDLRPRGGRVADLGTGSGHIAAYLHGRGLDVTGVDLAAGMIEEARRRHPDVRFEVGDLLRLDAADGAFAGLTAFYAIVHLDPSQLVAACVEAHRVLAPAGTLLLAWHVGDETVRLDEFLGEPCTIAWNFFPTETVVAAVETAGLTAEVRVERAPYAAEHPSTRGYLLARRP